MQGLVLHSYRRCPFAIRVRMVLEEKGIPYHTIEESLSEPSTALLKLNPAGSVPVLIHDGNAMTESAVITEYLDETFPEIPLMPQAPLEKARVRLWTRWCDAQFKPDLDLYKYEWPRLTPEHQQELVTRMLDHLGRLTGALQKSDFLMGQDLTLADIHVFPFYRQLSAVKSEVVALKDFPDVNAWLERILNRPSFQRVIEKK
jgi:glutathione S-transferase